VPVPLWLVRIDYIFHSPDFVTASAVVTRSAGRSDHRGVLATLVLQ
jgi:endonuclease/exonuclease/phosphatase family metal-dependent hydrolase